MLEPLDKQTRRTLADLPGPTWREWFFYSFLKTWIALGFFVLDAIVIVFWLSPFEPGPLAASLAVVLYVELLLYRFLWYRPDLSGPRAAGKFQPSWLRPVEFGRWTPEAAIARSGQSPYPRPAGPNPREFL